MRMDTFALQMVLRESGFFPLSLDDLCLVIVESDYGDFVLTVSCVEGQICFGITREIALTSFQLGTFIRSFSLSPSCLWLLRQQKGCFVVDAFSTLGAEQMTAMVVAGVVAELVKMAEALEEFCRFTLPLPCHQSNAKCGLALHC